MNFDIQTLRKKDDGFTLVELAVVMIIIGLLIAGILKGQELIANARITSTISQMQGIGAAVDGFTEAYNALPGDMNNATTRLVGCAAPCGDGDGLGFINVNIGAAPAAAGDEGSNFYLHLAQANFLTGIDNSGIGFGQSNPVAPIGGGFLVGDTRSGVTNFTAAEFRPGLYIVHNGSFADSASGAAATGVLSPTQAARIDRRLDDGAPSTGVVIADSSIGGGVGQCRLAAATYDEGNQAGVCTIAFGM